MEITRAISVVRIDTRCIATLICPTCGRHLHSEFGGGLHRAFCQCGSALDADAVHAAFGFDAGAAYAYNATGRATPILRSRCTNVSSPVATPSR